jgi:chromosome segregation ATPase
METEQIIKRVDWLDDERRKDKNVLVTVEERLTALEGNFPPLNQQIKELEGEVTRLGALLGRMDDFDESLLQQRRELRELISSLEKDLRKRGTESEKILRSEIRAYDSSLEEIRGELSPIPDLKRGLQARMEEESRLSGLIDELRKKTEDIRLHEEEYIRSYRLLEDARRQDTKRLTDLQGEVASLRKRADDQRGRLELLASGISKLETRVTELVSYENERREAQDEFLENQTMVQVERDRTWKEWQNRFDTIESQAADVEQNLQLLDSTHRAVKRSQENLDELSQKVDRRINEMTEIQRLSEERFRQEWVTFKADDQKRWTNYTLTQEEQRGEILRQFDKLADRVTQLEDNAQEIRDLIQQMNEQSEKRLQALLSMAHDWMSSYDRSLGRGR